MPDDSLTRAEELFDDGQAQEALDAARTLLDADALPTGTDREGRAWRVLGLALRRLGRADEAAPALERAFALLPHDREVLAVHGQLLAERGRHADALGVLRTLLDEHGDSLTERSRDRTNRTLADLHEARARDIERGEDPDLDDALDHWRHAFVRAPSDERFRELEARLEARDAWDELATLLEFQWVRGPADERAALAERIEALLGQTLGATDRLARFLDRVVADAPADLGAFERFTRAAAEARDWTLLHDGYARLIHHVSANDPGNVALRSLLWRNLGELCANHLDLPEEALVAWRTAESLAPDESNREAIARLGERLQRADDDTRLLEEAWHAAPDRPDLGERLGAALLRAGITDRGYLVLREVLASGAASDRARGIVQAMEARRPLADMKPLTDALRDRHLRPEGASRSLELLFRVATNALLPMWARDEDALGLRSRDRIRLDQPLLFTRVHRQVSTVLGWQDPPELWIHEATPGVAPAFFLRPALLVSPTLLAGRDERELRYLLAQALFMSRPRNLLAGLLDAQALESLAVALVRVTSTDHAGDASPLDADVRRQLERAVAGTWEQPLRLAVERVRADDALPRVRDWLRDVVREADRTALLISDDIGVTIRGIAANCPIPLAIDPRIRQSELLAWYRSLVYVTLRAELGIAV